MDKTLVTKIEQWNGPDLIAKGYLCEAITKQYKKTLVYLIDLDIADVIPDNLFDNVMFCKDVMFCKYFI